MTIFNSYVSLPEGSQCMSIWVTWIMAIQWLWGDSSVPRLACHHLHCLGTLVSPRRLLMPACCVAENHGGQVQVTLLWEHTGTVWPFGNLTTFDYMVNHHFHHLFLWAIFHSKLLHHQVYVSPSLVFSCLKRKQTWSSTAWSKEY